MKDHAYNVVVVFCYLIKDDKVLLIKRGLPPFKGEYTVVGGKKKPGEDLIAACKREVFEETNIEIEKPALRGIINIFTEGRDYETAAVYFQAYVSSEEFSSSNEGELHWCSIEESFTKEGISEYYLIISPYIFYKNEIFMGSITVDEKGRIKNQNLY